MQRRRAGAVESAAGRFTAPESRDATTDASSGSTRLACSIRNDGRSTRMPGGVMSVYVPLNGSKRELLPNSHAAGPIDLSEIASLTIRVRSVGDPMDLVQRAHELGRTPVAERRYLTHAELAEQHGAAEADLEAVARFATGHNLVVVRRS